MTAYVQLEHVVLLFLQERELAQAELDGESGCQLNIHFL